MTWFVVEQMVNILMTSHAPIQSSTASATGKLCTEEHINFSVQPKHADLKKLSAVATFKTRLMVANATVMSLFTYMIPVWGGDRGLHCQSSPSDTE